MKTMDRKGRETREHSEYTENFHDIFLPCILVKKKIART